MVCHLRTLAQPVRRQSGRVRRSRQFIPDLDFVAIGVCEEEVRFAGHELAARIDDARPTVVVSASCGIEPSRTVEYKPMLDKALAINPDDVPDIRLATIIAQQRARILQSRVDELFTAAGAPSPAAPRLAVVPPVPHAPVPVVFP